MSQFAWPDQVATLSTMLNTLEAGVKRGDPGAASLAEFKSALDDLRLRTWSLLSAVNADHPHAFQERFRAHRGTERAAPAPPPARQAAQRPTGPAGLGDAAKELSGAVKEATRKLPRGAARAHAERRGQTLHRRINREVLPIDQATVLERVQQHWEHRARMRPR